MKVRFIALLLGMFCQMAVADMQPFERGSYQKIVKSHAGKPLIVSFWSVGCDYCKAEMGLLKHLSKLYPKVNIVLVSTDSADEQAEINATLKKYAPGQAQTWLFADYFVERLRADIDKKWQGELPRSYFINSKGESLAVSGKVEMADLEAWAKAQ